MHLASFIRPLATGLVIIAVWGCDSEDKDEHDDLTSEVVSCEEAIAHLDGCCPGFVATRDGQCVDQDYVKHGGGCIYEDYDSLRTIRRLPEMTRGESKCVRELSCEDLVRKGICERVTRNGFRGNESYSYNDHIDHVTENSASTYPHEAVCP